MSGSARDSSATTEVRNQSEQDAPKRRQIDWGWSVNRYMEHARLSVGDGPDFNFSKLIKAKLEAADAGHKVGGVEGIGIVQDKRNEARALIAAAIEQGLPQMSDDDMVVDGLIFTVLETALKAEDLRMERPADNPFAHQLELETMCHALTSAVMFLLCRQLSQIDPALTDLDRPAASPEQSNQSGKGE